MKGTTGIIVAIGLGIAGALANLFYLYSESHKVQLVSFIGIKKPVACGERLVEDNLLEVKIPQDQARSLVKYACPWSALKSVTNETVWRALDNSEGAVLLLWSDIKTPHKELELGKGERAAYVPLPRNVVTSQINPGDKVSFKFWNAVPAPTPARKEPTSASGTAEIDPKAEDAEAIAQVTGPSEVIGPFVVKSIGNRLDSAEVMKAAKIPQVQENILVIRVSETEPAEKERYEKLGMRLHSAGAGSYDLLLHGKE